jgi:hypothetical protein
VAILIKVIVPLVIQAGMDIMIHTTKVILMGTMALHIELGEPRFLHLVVKALLQLPVLIFKI